MLSDNTTVDANAKTSINANNGTKHFGGLTWYDGNGANTPLRQIVLPSSEGTTSITATGGIPSSATKSIDVKVEDGTLVPEDSEPLWAKAIEGVVNNTNVQEFIAGSDIGLTYGSDFTTNKYKKVDDNSRFLKDYKQIEATVNLGASIMVNTPYSISFDEGGVKADVGFFVDVSGEATLKFDFIEYKLNDGAENVVFEKEEGGVVGEMCIQPKLAANTSVGFGSGGKTYEVFGTTVEGSVKACLATSIDVSNGEAKGSIYIPPVTINGTFDVRFGGSSILPNGPVDKTYPVIDNNIYLWQNISLFNYKN